MKIQHTLFSWLITCIGGSILLLLGIALLEHPGNIFGNNSAENSFYVLFFGSVISLAASIPAFILYHILGSALYRNMPQDHIPAKVILTIYAALTPLITLWLISVCLIGERHMFERDNNEVMGVLLPYMICFAGCVWLFGNRSRQNENGATGVQTTAKEDDFPKQPVTIYALIVILSECWSIYAMLRYWQYYHTPDKILTPAITAIHIAAVVLLCMRKPAGWYACAVLTVCFTLSSLLFLGKTAMTDTRALSGYLNASWIFFFLLDIVRLVLVMLPAIRRYFGITAPKLGATIIVGCLLAAALFFSRL